MDQDWRCSSAACQAWGFFNLQYLEAESWRAEDHLSPKNLASYFPPHPSQWQGFKTWPHIKFSLRKADPPSDPIHTCLSGFVLNCPRKATQIPHNSFLSSLESFAHYCDGLHHNSQGVYCIHHLFPIPLTVPSVGCSINICWSNHLTHPGTPQGKPGALSANPQSRGRV